MIIHSLVGGWSLALRSSRWHNFNRLPRISFFTTLPKSTTLPEYLPTRSRITLDIFSGWSVFLRIGPVFSFKTRSSLDHRTGTSLNGTILIHTCIPIQSSGFTPSQESRFKEAENPENRLFKPTFQPKLLTSNWLSKLRPIVIFLFIISFMQVANYSTYFSSWFFNAISYWQYGLRNLTREFSEASFGAYIAKNTYMILYNK